MTNLATTRAAAVDAEALAHAKALLREFRDDMDSASGHVFAEAMLRQCALMHPDNMLQFIAWARAGDATAEKMLLGLANELMNVGQLEGRHRALAVYIMERNAGQQHQRRLSGRRRADYLTRDICIVGAVGDLVHRFGLRPMRNRESRSPTQRQSACAIVAQALKETAADPRLKLSERAIEGIWERFGPTFCRWASLAFDGTSVP
jgi:hypothetical protein